MHCTWSLQSQSKLIGARDRSSAVAPRASRRDVLLATSAFASGVTTQPDGTSEPELFSVPDYTIQGPLVIQKLPKLEHTCIKCFPACQINKCLLRVEVWYPKGGPAIGEAPPYPLAIFSTGFLVPSEFYQSYARRLTSWGYTVMLYDKMESAVDVADDDLSALFLTELIDWAGSDPVLRQIADPRRVYLLGHSRGAKVATLAAASDPRVSALCLIDPVDNTVYAPLGPGFPSAAAALRKIPPSRSLPVAIVGAGLGGDCVPVGSNHDVFYTAAQGAAWEVVIAGCSHFQFLDRQSLVQSAICGQGPAPAAAVRRITQGVMVAWGQLAKHGPSMWQTHSADNLMSTADSGLSGGLWQNVASGAHHSAPQWSQVALGVSVRAEYMLRKEVKPGGQQFDLRYRIKDGLSGLPER